jgi:hypothetical protein
MIKKLRQLNKELSQINNELLRLPDIDKMKDEDYIKKIELEEKQNKIIQELDQTSEE